MLEALDGVCRVLEAWMWAPFDRRVRRAMNVGDCEKAYAVPELLETIRGMLEPQEGCAMRCGA